MGPLGLPGLKDSESTPCFSGHQVEEVFLDLPIGARVGQLPADRDIKTDNLHYTSHWGFAGHTVLVRREFAATVDQPLCTGKTRVAAAAALKQIREDYQSVMFLSGS